MSENPRYVTLRVPGTVYNECFDPLATHYPEEANLPKPTWKKVGKGHQASYEVSEEAARDMLDHAQNFGEAISYGVDDPRPGRTVVRWAIRERERLGLR